MKTEAAIS